MLMASDVFVAVLYKQMQEAERVEYDLIRDVYTFPKDGRTPQPAEGYSGEMMRIIYDELLKMRLNASLSHKRQYILDQLDEIRHMEIGGMNHEPGTK